MVAQQSSSSEEKKELEPSPAQQSSSAEGIVEPSLEISTPSKQNDTTVQKTKIFYKFSVCLNGKLTPQFPLEPLFLIFLVVQTLNFCP